MSDLSHLPPINRTREGLTRRQENFVIEYPVDFIATYAAIRAGYSKAGARVAGCNLLKNPKVRAALEWDARKRAERTQITADRVLTEMGKLGFSNMDDYSRISKDGDPYIDLSKLTREQAAAIQEITVEDYTEGRGEDARDVRKVRIKLYDKRAALVELGKYTGLEKPDNSKNTTYNIQMNMYGKQSD